MSQPLTDEELAAVTVGGLKRLDGPVELADPDPTWPAQYEAEAAAVREILGDRVLRLEHVGSTSVPGLPAKPIIDMLLVVADPADEDDYVAPLEAAGYTLRIREPDWHEHRLLRGPRITIILHLFGPDCVEIGRMVGFRDYLRANPTERDLYLDTKRELAGRTWDYLQRYADAKGEVVEAIIARARAAGYGS
jgi:GrpB-like predicted nucleotidyltransferase (UPF0157 family)